MAFIVGSIGVLEDIAIVVGEIIKKAIQVVVVEVVRITDVVEVGIEAIEIERLTKDEKEMVKLIFNIQPIIRQEQTIK